jgi:hypothetical protein
LHKHGANRVIQHAQNPLVSEEGMHGEIIEFLPIVVVECKNWKSVLCGNIRVKREKNGEHFTLLTHWKCPGVMCKVIQDNMIVLKTRITQYRSPDIRMKQLKQKESFRGGIQKGEPHMLTKLADLAGVRGKFITLKIKIKGAQSLKKAVTARVSQSLVPKLDGGGGSVEGFGWPKIERVEVPVTITSQHHHLDLQILDREAEWIKFNKNKIVTC